MQNVSDTCSSELPPDKLLYVLLSSPTKKHSYLPSRCCLNLPLNQKSWHGTYWYVKNSITVTAFDLKFLSPN
eukprot:202686-Amphidinium_carterae.1